MARRRFTLTSPRMARIVCKLGTIAHNRPFSARDFVEYTGGSTSMLERLRREGVVKRLKRNSYYPTPGGWNAIERACGLKRD